MLLRPFKIKAIDSLILIGFGTWISQGDGVGNGTGDGLPSGSKPRGTIIFILL